MIRASLIGLSSLLLLPLPSWASNEVPSFDDDVLSEFAEADVVILGEVHDNPAHHVVQAEITRHVSPNAIIFEMLSEDQARTITSANKQDEATLEAALDWNASGWPDFSMYYPIFSVTPEARIYGAQINRSMARQAMSEGVEAVLGDSAAELGLITSLPEAEQAEREVLQAKAHCDALPTEMLPAMVTVQRLRDAVLARTAIQALDETGGPVIVITGNGHARADWGMPVYLRRLRPEINIVTLGQGEDGRPPPGQFDLVLSSTAPERDDPCAAFN